MKHIKTKTAEFSKSLKLLTSLTSNRRVLQLLKFKTKSNNKIIQIIHTANNTLTFNRRDFHNINIFKITNIKSSCLSNP